MHEELLSLFHPATARWFRESFAGPTPAQLMGWPAIAAGKNTLILAPTGSGKTLAAFLFAMDELIVQREKAHSETRGVHTLYVSPLKALANDIERNLEPPLRGIRSSAEHLGVSLPEIRVGLRTGDTPRAEQWHARRRGVAWGGGGRWSVVESGGRKRSVDDVRGALGVLLHRYGVLNRDVFERDGLGLRWADAYPILTRQEWAGEVERGVFVSSFSTPQFASRGAIDGLHEATGGDAPILVNAFDPACIYSGIAPVDLPNGERFVVRRHPANYIVCCAGRAILAVENRGERLVPLEDMGHDERRAALVTVRRLVEGRNRPPSVRVKTWRGRAVVDTPIASELESVGFVREDRSMILYRDYEARRPR